MTRRLEESGDRDGEVRLSRRLVGLHVGGVLLLISVVLSTVVWISAEHNKLAVQSSERMVQAGIDSFRTRLRTLVEDYSVWDEAYAAAVTDDRDWLYSNIGTAASEIGTLDLIVFIDPTAGEPFGWTEGSPPEGETGLLPADVLAQIIDSLSRGIDENGRFPTVLALRESLPWAFTAARVVPVEGPPAGVAPELLPIQVHGLRLAGDRLKRIGQGLLIDDLSLSDTPVRSLAKIPLIDYAGRTISYVTWMLPPGYGGIHVT